jgi:flagellar biosynthesis protein FlhF
VNLVPFIAESATSALAQIQARLGPNAVVVSVRRLPAQGVSRLWSRSGGIEVLAGVPSEGASEPAAGCEAASPERTEPNDEAWPAAHPVLEAAGDGRIPIGQEMSAAANPDVDQGQPGGAQGWLARLGLLPLPARRVLALVRAHPEHTGLADGVEELVALGTTLSQLWRQPPPLEEQGRLRPHVLVGPPGSGKTTALCKWLANAVLLESRSARVWRLDGHASNTAESLSVYGDILGVPVERFWTGDAAFSSELNFVDLPGVDAQDGAAFEALAVRLRELANPRVHLVLNAAYETPLLLAQARAFAPLAPEDVVFTHLDEELRWGKLWNVVLGTNYTIRFLSAGQNIPGRFLTATPEQLLPPAFRPR